MMEKHGFLEKSTSADCSGRKVSSKYTCGACQHTYQTISVLHEHLIDHIEGGSYHYDNNSKTAFPKYDSKCEETQTDLTKSCIILDFCESKTSDTTHTDAFGLSDQQNHFVNGTQPIPNTINYDMIHKSHEQQLNSETGDTDKQQSVVIKTEVIDSYTVMTTDSFYKDFDKQLHYPDENILPVQDILTTMKDELPHQKDNKDRPEKIFTTYFKKKQITDNYKDQDLNDVGIPNDYNPGSDTDDYDIELNTTYKLNPTKNETKTCLLKIDKNCIKCDKKFSKIDLFKNHLAEVHGDNPWICCKCGKSYTTKAQLETHKTKERYHQPAYRCTLCGSMLDSHKSLTQHKLEKHVNELSIYRCLECKKQFVNMNKYKAHMDCMHCENPVLLICETCGFQTTKKSTMTRHKAKHADKKHSCPECSYKSYSKDNLSKHMITHSDKKDHVCYICGKSFRFSCSLKRHLRMHSGEKLFKCTLCPKAFTDQSGYMRHKQVHTQDKCHTCPYCDKTFLQKSNCIAHMRQHTGDKPYICDVCGAGFTHNVSKKNHMLKAHF